MPSRQSHRALFVLVLAACGPQASGARVSTQGGGAARPVGPPPGPAQPGAFVRAPPPWHALRGVDACAYAGNDGPGPGSACVDALTVEADPIRVRYILRLAAARAGTRRPRPDPELVECCSRAGPCGADKRSGHADCPRMDDGYACLFAAESAREQGATFHERACRCDPTRARIPIPGGTLACEGPRPIRQPALPPTEAEEALACATCDREAGPAACAAEIARLEPGDPGLARWIERVHVVRCQVP